MYFFRPWLKICDFEDGNHQQENESSKRLLFYGFETCKVFFMFLTSFHINNDQASFILVLHKITYTHTQKYSQLCQQANFQDKLHCQRLLRKTLPLFALTIRLSSPQHAHCNFPALSRIYPHWNLNSKLNTKLRLESQVECGFKSDFQIEQLIHRESAYITSLSSLSEVDI